MLTHRLFFDCVPSIKGTLATMPYGIFIEASPVDELLTSDQGPGTKSSAISVAIASNNTTAGQAQGTPQLQGPSSNAVHPSTTSRDAQDLHPGGGRFPLAIPLAMATGIGDFFPANPTVPTATLPLNTDIPASSTEISVGISKSVQSLPNVPRSSSAALQPSSTKEVSNLPTPTTEKVLTPGLSTKLSSPDIDARLGLMSGTQTSTADYKPQYIFSSSHTFILDSTPTLGFDTRTSAQALPISITRVLHDSGSTASLLFRPAATPSISKESSPLMISGQTVTANSLGQYSIDNQTLTPGGVITVSGSKISLAPNASDLIIGTSTEALGPSVSAYLGSGPKGTEVQKFTGNALGARDGLWSSSTMLLVSFLLLLWL